jgi:hypothetical protein
MFHLLNIKSMKKITVLVFMSLMAMVSLAQDIIITTNKEKIEAKVLEVSTSAIKYKKHSYLDGPTFVLETDKIVCVAYEDDNVDLLTPIKNDKSIYSMPILNTSNDENLGFITKVGDLYTLYTKDSRTPMDKKAYINFIKNNSPEAWSEWKKGTTLMNTGWGLFAGGIASVLCIGLPMYIEGYYWDVEFTGIMFMTVVGPCLTIASIPLLSVGASKRNNSYKNYNQQTAAQLILGGSQNGVGLRITF